MFCMTTYLLPFIFNIFLSKIATIIYDLDDYYIIKIVKKN